MTRFFRRPWMRQFSQAVLPAKGDAGTSRGYRTSLVFEALEMRSMMHAGHESDYALTEHVHEHLTIRINGENFAIPANIGVSSNAILANPHTHATDGILHIHPITGTTLTDFPTLGDFFDVWRTNAGLAGNNPNAIFNENNLLGNVTDANHVIRMFVNGEVSTEFEDYVLNDSDQVVLSYESLPAANAPLLNPIGNLTMPAGTTFQVPLTATDPNGNSLTYQVTSSDPQVTATVLTGGRSLKLTVSGKDEHNNSFSGVITLRLFEDLAPETTARIIQLVQSGFYDGLKFHRIIDGFMAQGGDPEGDGTGGSGVDFDDEFDPSLTFNGYGQLAMAKSNDDTNDSQFFITDSNLSFNNGTDGSGTQTPPQHLNFNHTIFGQLTSGWDVFNNLIRTPVTGQTPNSPVIITKAEIITDTQNGVLRISAPRSYRGTPTITVNVNDGTGNSQERKFTMNVVAPSTDSAPFIGEFDSTVQIPNSQSISIPLEAFDIDGDNIEFGYFFDGPGGETGSNTPRVEVTFTPGTATPVNGKATATLLIQPKDGFIGVTNLYIYAFKPGTSPTQSTADVQRIDLTIQPGAPTSIDLADVSDSGPSNTDNVTNRNNANTKTLIFNVSGVQSGATVTIYADGNVVGTGTASGSTVAITTNNTFTLTDGPHVFTARQIVGTAESAATPNLVVTVDRAVPQISSDAITTVPLGQSYEYDAQSPEEGDDGLVYSVITGPAGLGIDSATGEVTWDTPTLGAHAVTIRLTDQAGNFIDQSFTLQVQPSAPASIDLVDASDTGVSNSDNITSRNNNGGKTLTFTVTGVQNGATVTIFSDGVAVGSAIASGTTATVTTNNTVLIADGNRSFTARQTISGAQSNNSPALAVTIDATGPQITSTAITTVPSGQPYSYNVVSPEEGNPDVVYSLPTGPSGMSIDPTTGQVTWSATVTGAFPVVIRIVDKAGAQTEQSFTLESQGVGPTLIDLANASDSGASDTDNLTNRNNAGGKTLAFTVGGVENGATVTVFADGVAIGSGVASSGVATVITNNSVTLTNGAHTFVARQRVGGVDSVASPELVVTIDSINPLINTAPVTSVPVGQAYSYNAGSPEEGNSGLVYSLANAPTGMSIDSATGVASWATPVVGSHPVTIRLIDKAGNLFEQAFTLRVNAAPQLAAITNKLVNEGVQLTFTASATDGNAPLETLTYSLTGNVPAGATINATTGVFTWTPTEAQGPATYTFTVRVVDSTGLADTKDVSVEVDEENARPVLAAIGDKTAEAGHKLEFDAVGTDADVPVQTLTYSLDAGAPQGAAIDPVTGHFAWTPTGAQSNATYTISVRVTDSAGKSAATPVEVTVLAFNEAPVVTSVANQTVKSGSQLRFHVPATDPNLPLDTLTYLLAAGAPAGAAIDAHSGEFTWTPTAGQGPGTYEVKVKVSDARGLEDATTFFIEVTAVEDNNGGSNGGGVSTDVAFGATVARFSQNPAVLPPAPQIINVPSGVIPVLPQVIQFFTTPPAVPVQDDLLDTVGSGGAVVDSTAGGDTAGANNGLIDENVKPASGEEEIDEPAVDPAKKSSKSGAKPTTGKPAQQPPADEFSAVDPTTVDQALAELLSEAAR